MRKFREARNLGYAELSRRLAELGREIPSLGLRRIEAGERRVDVDDLVALALALDVAPVALLFPSRRTREIASWCPMAIRCPGSTSGCGERGCGRCRATSLSVHPGLQSAQVGEVGAVVAKFSSEGGLSGNAGEAQ